MGDNREDLSLVDRINLHIAERQARPAGDRMPDLPTVKSPMAKDSAADAAIAREPDDVLELEASDTVADEKSKLDKPEIDDEVARDVAMSKLDQMLERAVKRDPEPEAEEPAEPPVFGRAKKQGRDVLDLPAEAETDDAKTAQENEPPPAPAAKAPVPPPKPAPKPEPKPVAAKAPAADMRSTLVEDEQIKLDSPPPGTETPADIFTTDEEQAQARVSGDYVPVITAQIKQMLDALNSHKDKPDQGRALCDELQGICQTIREQAAAHDYGLISWAAENLAAFLARQKGFDKPQHKVTMAHLETMRQVIQGRITGDGGTQGNLLLQELTQITYADLRKQAG